MLRIPNGNSRRAVRPRVKSSEVETLAQCLNSSLAYYLNMKRILSLLFAAAILSSCQSLRTYTHTQQRWFLNTQAFAGQTNAAMAPRISSAEMQGRHIKLYVHVTDTNHFHYQGIPTDAFCNVSIQQNYSNPIAVQNLKVTEYRKVEHRPTAIAFVLDYSGSMGNKKDRLYQITRDFIDKKKDEDAYSITRYADYTFLDVPLTQDKVFLKNEFKPQPAKSIGNLTATWDGIADGVNTLLDSPYPEKVLIVMTDGGENASKITQEWAFWKAKAAGVKIMAISLGSAGELNMKSLCEQTGGMYTHINYIEEMQQAFTDFQNKQSSYYLVEFDTPLEGRQTIHLNLCGAISASDQYTFDNSPLGNEPIRLKTGSPAPAPAPSPSPAPTPASSPTPRPTTPSGTTASNTTPRPPTTTPPPIIRIPTSVPNSGSQGGGIRTPTPTNTTPSGTVSGRGATAPPPTIPGPRR